MFFLCLAWTSSRWVRELSSCLQLELELGSVRRDDKVLPLSCAGAELCVVAKGVL